MGYTGQLQSSGDVLDRVWYLTRPTHTQPSGWGPDVWDRERSKDGLCAVTTDRAMVICMRSPGFHQAIQGTMGNWSGRGWLCVERGSSGIECSIHKSLSLSHTLEWVKLQGKHPGGMAPHRVSSLVISITFPTLVSAKLFSSTFWLICRLDAIDHSAASMLIS